MKIQSYYHGPDALCVSRSITCLYFSLIINLIVNFSFDLGNFIFYFELPLHLTLKKTLTFDIENDLIIDLGISLTFGLDSDL